jgi:RNA polymerase sigma factor (sigma-70 family)
MTRGGDCDNPSGISFQQFYEEHDLTVRAVIKKYVPRSLGDPDDLSQEVWRQFFEGKNGVSYMQIYNPDTSSPKTFMWEFTKRRCLQFLSRSNRTPTAKAYSIQSQASEFFVVGIVDPETTKELSFNEQDRIEYEDLVRRAEEAVHAQPIRGRRDLRWVWRLLREGFRQDQIASEMKLSEGTISICVDLIRQIPEVQALREWATEQGLLHRTGADALAVSG